VSVISGVSEGTWIVFAEKAMAERDAAIEGTEKMRDALRAAEKRELEALAELDEAKCERDACRAMEKAAELRGERLFRDRALVDERARRAAQLLIAEVGAEGPMNVDDATKAAVNEIHRLKMRLKELEWGNEMACENTPVASCDCPGCMVARDRAERNITSPEGRRCACQFEAGDSPCPIHGEHDE